MAEPTAMPDLIAEAQTTEERFLRQIFVRDQMDEWSKHRVRSANLTVVDFAAESGEVSRASRQA